MLDNIDAKLQLDVAPKVFVMLGASLIVPILVLGIVTLILKKV